MNCQEFQVRIELTIKDFADPRLTIWLLEREDNHTIEAVDCLVGLVGLEPTTNRLKARYSTIELQTQGEG